jgi:ribosomal subunit interface protein
MIPKWIVIVERARARLFKTRPFRLMHLFDNELGRERNRALMRDKPGAGKAAPRSNTRVVDGMRNPHDDVAIQFARRLAGDLEKRFPALTLAAGEMLISCEPRMMGFLREEMTPAMRAKVDWRDKDLGYFSDDQIRRMFHGRKDGSRRVRGRDDRDSVIPLTLVSRDFPITDAVHDVVWECTQKLLGFFDRVIRCEVALSSPLRRRRKGRVYRIQIRLHVPGPDIVVVHEAQGASASANFYVAVRGAFKAVTRQLEDRVRVMRGRTKQRRSEQRRRAAELERNFLMPSA